MRAWVAIVSLLCVAMFAGGCSSDGVEAAVPPSPTLFASPGLSCVLPARDASAAKMDTLVAAIEAREAAKQQAARDKKLAEAKALAAAKAAATARALAQSSGRSAQDSPTRRAASPAAKTGLTEAQKAQAMKQRAILLAQEGHAKMMRELEEQMRIIDQQR